MPITTQGLMATGMPSHQARYIAENAQPGGLPVVAVLDIPAAGPFPVAMAGPDYATFTEWANATVNEAFTYANGVLAAQSPMVVFFGMALNFEAPGTDEVRARVRINSSAVEFEGCTFGSAARESIAVSGVAPLMAGDTIEVQLLDPAGPAGVVMVESALSVCGLITEREGMMKAGNAQET